MSESKHTPGPWRLYTDAKGRVSKIESKTGRVCTIQPGDKNRDANAALIARAPDLLRENEELRAQNAELLDVCKWVVEANRRMVGTYEKAGALVVAAGMARTAIAKAKGEE